jgi:large subunit ribosomal protein L3
MSNIGVVATKCGMTRIFNPDDGSSTPVSVLLVEPNRIAQKKTSAKEGYNAVQVTTGTCKTSRLTKPEAGHYAKANVEPGRGLWEFRTTAEENESFAVGTEITLERFSVGQKVDVIGVSRGRGFSGVIKRHNFKSQRASHGNSLSHNAPGSIGQNQSPGRVFKGKKMSGQYGNTRTTVQSLEVVRVDVERNVLLIKGAVPGAPGGTVFIRPAVKYASKLSPEVRGV